MRAGTNLRESVATEPRRAASRGKTQAERAPLTRMERGQRVRQSLDHYRFLVFAEGLAEGVGDFAYGSEGFYGGEDGRDEVFGGGGAAG